MTTLEIHHCPQSVVSGPSFEAIAESIRVRRCAFGEVGRPLVAEQPRPFALGAREVV
jgi:hypothetical protein